MNKGPSYMDRKKTTQFVFISSPFIGESLCAVVTIMPLVDPKVDFISSLSL